MRSIQQLTPKRSHVTDAVGTVVTEDSETDICDAIGQWERPCIARQKVSLEPDHEFIGSTRRNVSEVLTECVPLAAIPRLRKTESFASWRPHSICGDHVGGAKRFARFRGDERISIALLNSG
ncbi:unannotated protein [freshwater metagenome]|uniref:Unannotated protein n=1 Tax=freshwater metagenome TaxID=449393 RepID=A0A6J6A197_9ZZZZ